MAEINLNVFERDSSVDMSVNAQVHMGSEVTKAYVDAGDAVSVQAAKDYANEHVPSVVAAYVTEHKDELKGERGLPGEAGQPGQPGSDGQPGKDGVPGSDGLSAYQIAREHGYGGTETQWLASLKGADGERGLTGESGERGLPGERGVDGAQGAAGADGNDGYSPVRGIDYWTDADIASIKAYVDDAILCGAW